MSKSTLPHDVENVAILTLYFGIGFLGGRLAAPAELGAGVGIALGVGLVGLLSVVHRRLSAGE
jgi:hypothetical protein